MPAWASSNWFAAHVYPLISSQRHLLGQQGEIEGSPTPGKEKTSFPHHPRAKVKIKYSLHLKAIRPRC